MKLYLMLDPTSGFLKSAEPPIPFAEFAAVGTWSPGIRCPECGSGTSIKVEPMLIEWDPGSDVIADFSWSGGYTTAVIPRVVRFFREAQFECDFRKTEVVVPTEKIRKRDVRVAFPYVGPKLKWLVATRVVRLNETLSGVVTKSECTTCGRVRKTFKYEDIVIDRDATGDASVFRIASNGRSDATFVTEAAKAKIESQQFTNIAFLEAGHIHGL